MMVLIADLSSFLYSVIACGLMYLNVILSGEYMFVFIIFFPQYPFHWGAISVKFFRTLKKFYWTIADV